MELNEKNYFSPEMAMKYLSVSQIKSFIGTPFQEKCEARAMAELKGEWTREKSESLLVGSYLDEMITGTEESLKRFIENTPEMFYANGSGKLLAKFQRANEMAETVRNDEVMNNILNDGIHQKILVGELFGFPTKIKIDVLRDKSIIDLKTVESIGKTYYDAVSKRHISFVQYFDYILQGSIYTTIASQNFKKDYKFVLACVSKEKEPDKALIEIDAETMNERLYGNSDVGIPSLEESIKHIVALKNESIKATACGHCEYCRKHKKITHIINWQEIAGEVGE